MLVQIDADRLDGKRTQHRKRFERFADWSAIAQDDKAWQCTRYECLLSKQSSLNGTPSLFAVDYGGERSAC